MYAGIAAEAKSKTNNLYMSLHLIGMAIPRRISLIEESRNGNLTFLGDRGGQNLFLGGPRGISRSFLFFYTFKNHQNEVPKFKFELIKLITMPFCYSKYKLSK